MSLYETFVQPIAQNPVVTGLSFTAALGALGYQLRRVPSILDQIVRRGTVVSLTVFSTDPAFTWVERWLASQPYSQRAKMVTLRSYDEDGDRASYGSQAQNWALSPGDGMHWFWWNRRFIWLQRSTNSPQQGGGPASQRVETIQLFTFGRSQVTLRSIVKSAQQAARSRDVVSIRLWRGYWAPVRGKRPRSLDTIVLSAGQSERVVSALRAFQSSAASYARRGIPWRLGCLFKGPPGTGKTSFVLALAGHLGRPICVLNLGSVQNDDALFSAVMDAPADAIILIEDIDCADSSQHRKKTEGVMPAGTSTPPPPQGATDEAGVTKAGLLNALDGITTPDGRIFVMTTNHPELLDPALIRPGRADVVEDFQYLGVAEQARMGALYYGPGAFTPLAHAQSPAAMQAAFMRFPDDPVAARRLLSENIAPQQEAA